MISLSQLVYRYQAGFGYVAANWAEIAADRLWAKYANIPLYQQRNVGTNGDEATPLFSVNDASFADMLFTSSKPPVEKFGFGSLSLKNSDGGLYGADSRYLAPPPMVTFSRGKNFVVTSIDRSEEEVIENFGLKSWQIKLQGILIDMDGHQYPQALVKKINEMFTKKGTFKVEGTIFGDLDIYEVFFKDDFELSFVEGYADTVKFSVSAMSTKAAKLTAIGY